MANISIPSDIIIEILYRLPVKSIGRFRCVSKKWLSLSSDHKFITTHLKATDRNHIIFSGGKFLYSHPFNHHESLLLTPAKFHLEPEDDGYNVYGSCDGLVLVSIRRYSDCIERFVLYNPTTRDFVELPRSDYGTQIDTMKGFGYDSVTDDYKVLTISYNRPYNKGGVLHVYSLRTNTWKMLTDYAYDYSFVDYSYRYMKDDWDLVDYSGYTCVFVNGFLHWIAEKNSNGLPVIIAFCLADEIFCEVLSPNLCHDFVDFISNKDSRLFALGGKLGIFLEGVVWLMNEYGKTESWTKILLYGLDEIQMDRPKVFDGNGRVLVADEHRMLEYDVEKRCLSKIAYVWNLKNFLVAGTCVESLVSPKFSQGQQRSKKRRPRRRGKASLGKAP